MTRPIARPRLGRIAVHGALLFYTLVAIGPILVLYILFSRQLVRGLTAGAVK